jgi:cytochrome c biogenesis protein CcdA
MTRELDVEQQSIVEKECNLVWPIERRYVRWYFSKLVVVNKTQLEQNLKFDGIEATTYRSASAFWAGACALFIAIALPLTLIGIFSNSKENWSETIGLLFYFLGIVFLFVSGARQFKRKSSLSRHRTERI